MACYGGGAYALENALQDLFDELDDNPWVVQPLRPGRGRLGQLSAPLANYPVSRVRRAKRVQRLPALLLAPSPAGHRQAGWLRSRTPR